MTQKQFSRKRPGKYYKVRELSKHTPNPVRIICIVVESCPGAALVQDICDEMGKQGTIRVTIGEELKVAERYILTGDVKENEENSGEDIRMIAFSAFNVTSLDINLFKEVLALGERVKPASRG